MGKLRIFFKNQTVLCIAALLAVFSMLFVHPSADYIGYINEDTLILLFSLMGAVGGLRLCGVFRRLAQFLTKKCQSARILAFVMMTTCFLTSMFITNDVALLTFVPITLMIYSEFTEKSAQSAMIWTIILETAAANLGSMMLPTGNPQNIYICSYYSLSPSELISTLLPYGIIAFAILSLSIRLLPSFRLECISQQAISDKFSWRTTICCIIIFVVALITVAGKCSAWVCLAVAIVLLLIANPRIYEYIDYFLLMTFICFFIFTGNLGKIETVRNFISNVLTNREMIVSILTSQVFSNVPAAILLSGFTENAKALLIGVNLGGLGTPIASLASLISFQLFSAEHHALSGKYIRNFLLYNLSFLAVITSLALLLTK